MLTKNIITHLCSLRTDKKYREDKQSVLIVGKKMVQELGPFKMILLEEGSTLFKGPNVYHATFEILKKITGLQNPDGVAAEMTMPERKSLKNKRAILCLDGIADPGNMGTLLRTALALNWDGVFITENSVDPFNDKALRAAKGATFHLPIMRGTQAELFSFILENQFSVYVADKKGENLKNFKPKTPFILILGNESQGSKLPFTPISIPMNPAMESLNVATAGAILMHELLC